MLFSLLPWGKSVPAGLTSKVFLREDNWDDWGKYRTMFQLFVFDSEGGRHDIGEVKIGHFGLLPGSQIGTNTRAPSIDQEFDSLGDNFFSLGQTENYYEALNQLPLDLKEAIFVALRDCAFDISIFDKAQSEEVMTSSLLRHISVKNVRNRFARLANGNAVLTPFEFEYVFASQGAQGLEPPVFVFQVTPESEPPSNIHVLIGRNGVGKTRNMQGIAQSLLEGGQSEDEIGYIRPIGESQDEWSFAGLISVSFSAFDDFDLPDVAHPKIRAHSIGLRKRVQAGNGGAESIKDPGTPGGGSENNAISIKTPADLGEDFTNSFARCRTGLRARRWLQAVKTLSNDPLFADIAIESLIELSDSDWLEMARNQYRLLSSGHKIVLLTITRLVELVDERTLVLIDEPEAHLHPPLLSALIRSLSNLLVQRNGVAIIATHSPVVLQEVPSSCATILQRSGAVVVAARPSIETFGESVGVLTREVFGLEVTTAGFHSLLRSAVDDAGLSYDEVINRFGGQLGAEARAIVRALVASRDLEQ